MSTTFSNVSNARRAAKAAGIPSALIKITPVGDRFGFTRAEEKAPELVNLATEDEDLGLIAKDKANVEAQKLANELGKTVYARDKTTDKVLATFKPKKAKAAKAPRAAKQKSDKGPTGMVAEIIKLACRAKGVTPAELNELTKWQKAPWKWLLANPKKTGFADRHGYTFSSTRDDDGVRYFLKKAA